MKVFKYILLGASVLATGFIVYKIGSYFNQVADWSTYPHEVLITDEHAQPITDMNVVVWSCVAVIPGLDKQCLLQEESKTDEQGKVYIHTIDAYIKGYKKGYIAFEKVDFSAVQAASIQAMMIEKAQKENNRAWNDYWTWYTYHETNAQNCESYPENFKNRCRSLVAYKTKDRSICEMMPDEDSKEMCTSYIVYATGDDSYCSDTEQNNYLCLGAFAAHRQDVKICENAVSKELCKNSYAQFNELEEEIKKASLYLPP